MDNLNKRLIHISVSLLIFHSIEEFYFGLIKVDPFLVPISQYFGLTNDTIYFIMQLILFIFLAITLFLIILGKNIKYEALIVGGILIFEFSHVYQAVISKSYYPGLVSGIVLFVLGIGYWYKVFKNRFI